MRKVYVLLILVFLSFTVSAQLSKWTYEGVSVSGTSSVSPSVTVGSSLADVGSLTTGSDFSGLHATNSTWSTVTGNGSTKALSGNNWAIGDYFQFLFSTVNYNSILITWDATGSNTGPRDYKVQYSTNGSTFTDATGTNSTYSLTNDSWSAGSSTGASTRTLDLSSVTALNNISTVYIRFVVTSTTSINAGTVAAGGTSRIDNFTVNGTFGGPITNFYSKATGNLTNVTTWGDQTDGTGTQPSNFVADGQIFNVVNRVSVTLDANWTVSGASSKVIVGDGLGATTLILPVGAALTGTIDVLNLSTLQLINTSLPTFGTLSLGSTVEYAQTTTPYVVPTGTTYHHLKVSSGGAGNIKTFASGTLAVNGNLTVDGVTGFNGSATPFTTLTLAGNFTLQNSATFEPIATGDGNRMTVTCSGTGGTQTLSGGDFFIFRLQTPAAGTNNIALSGANLTLGNASGGGMNLQLATHTLSLGSGNTLTIHRSGSITGTALGTITGNITANLIIDKTSGGTSIGSIGFTASARELLNLNYNCTSGASTTLILTTPLAVVGNLTMTAGLIDIGNNTLTVTGTATGITTSYVKTSGSSGGLQLLAITSLSRTFPVGKSTYNPLTISNGSNLDWTVRVEDVLTVDDPSFASNAVKAVQREWHILPSTTPPPSGADLVFQWNDSDPTQIGASYSNTENVQIWREVSSGQPWGNDWIAVGVAQIAGNFPGPGVRTATITGWTGFNAGFNSFAISNISGPLPVKLIDFTVSKLSDSRSLVSWNLASCCSSAARFIIEKSSDGNIFSSLAIVTGSETNRFYNYVDSRLGKGVTYYRLKMIDVDGKVAYSRVVVVINDIKGVLITSMTPNPVRDNATISISAAKAGTVNFIIYDMMGRPVKQWQSNVTEGSNTITVTAGELPAGIYHLAATTADAKTVMRFVKQ